MLIGSCCGFFAATNLFRETSPFPSRFGLCARTIETLGHFFNSFHHFFQYWFVLEEHDLASAPLKGFCFDIQACIHYQQKIGTLCRMDLFYFPAQVGRVPEPDQLDQNTPLLICGINQDEIGYHDRIAKQEHLAFPRELPVASFAANFLLKLAGKICFEPAVELT
jgi:hypothetical protein